MVGGEVGGRGRGGDMLVSTCVDRWTELVMSEAFGVSWGLAGGKLAGGNAAAAGAAGGDKCASGVVCDFVCLEERLAPVVLHLHLQRRLFVG